MSPVTLTTYLFILLVSFSCATQQTKTANQNVLDTDSRTVKMGRQTQVAGAPITTEINKKCTEPRPDYYTEKVRDALEAALDVKSVSITGIDRFEKDLKLLTANTPQGVDLHTTLFHICQIASNEQFSPTTTAHLLELTILQWGNKYSVREDEERSRRRERREKLAQFIQEGTNLQKRIIQEKDAPPLFNDARAWVRSVQLYFITLNDVPDYVDFTNPPTGPMFSVPGMSSKDHMELWNLIDAHINALRGIMRSIRD
jgi:hypothetical protein